MNFKKHFIALAVIASIFAVSSHALASTRRERREARRAPAERVSPVRIADWGSVAWINYEDFGRFEGVGTADFRFVITDMAGLREASGEGIWPNSSSAFRNPLVREMRAQGILPANRWDHVVTTDYEKNFFVWATTQYSPGLQQFYIAFALDRAGEYKHAIKAYYSLFINFPRTMGRSYWGEPWYAGVVALDRINFLLRENPHLGMRLEGAEITVTNTFGSGWDQGQEWIINPGRWVSATPECFMPQRLNLEEIGIRRTVGTGRVQLVEFNNGHFQLQVDGREFIIRGMCYVPTQVGLSPDAGNVCVSVDWQWADINNTGRPDGPFYSWIDVDRSNTKPENVEIIGDFRLMYEMGVNSIRLYHTHGGTRNQGTNFDLLMYGYKNFGFMYAVGNLIGKYGTDSGAEWFEGADYTNPIHLANMRDSVRRMVEDFRDKPYVLMWVLGNENNYGSVGVEGEFSGTSCRAREQPREFFTFVNELAHMIRAMDPYERPIAVSNGDTFLMHYAARYAPDIDIFFPNAYRGEAGFSNIWRDTQLVYGIPIAFGEFGCPAFHRYYDRDTTEALQAAYHRGNWLDIERNIAGFGYGNALGGYIFQWMDEWWKAGPPPEYCPYTQETTPQWGGPFLDGYAYEEWFGIISKGDGSYSPFLRQLRPAFFMYQDVLWARRREEDRLHRQGLPSSLEGMYTSIREADRRHRLGLPPLSGEEIIAQARAQTAQQDRRSRRRAR